MGFMKAKLAGLGVLMTVFGVTVTILSLFGYNITLFLWLNNWGTTMGWLIRIGFIIGGIILFVLFYNSQEEEY